MEQPLENRIVEAYHKKDQMYSYKKKDELWQRIAFYSGKKGVAAFWRVAAVILALITFGGAFASITIFEHNKEKLAESENQNRRLEFVIDSLQNRMPEKITEVKIIEKEKIVYRDVFKTSKENKINDEERQVLEDEVAQLTDLLSRSNSELKAIRDSLSFALMDLENLNTASKTHEVPVKDFRLKPEPVKDQMQEIKTEPSPKMKLQFLKVPNENLKYNSNSSLLKK